jgi:hypothetical protein
MLMPSINCPFLELASSNSFMLIFSHNNCQSLEVGKYNPCLSSHYGASRKFSDLFTLALNKTSECSFDWNLDLKVPCLLRLIDSQLKEHCAVYSTLCRHDSIILTSFLASILASVKPLEKNPHSRHSCAIVVFCLRHS